MPVMGVVVSLPVLDPDLGVEKGEPLVHVQTLLANTVVERLDEPVAPWLTGRDVTNPDLIFAKVSQCFGHEFWAIVTSNQRRQATHGNDEL